MTILFAVIGVALFFIVLGLNGIYKAQQGTFEVLRDVLKGLTVIWVAASENPEGRAERRKHFRLGPMYVHDENCAEDIWEHLNEYRAIRAAMGRFILKSKKSQKEEQEYEELCLAERVRSASATPEDLAAWLEKYPEAEIARELLTPNALYGPHI